MPFYKVTTKGAEGVRLVDATNAAAARKHAAQGAFTVSAPLKPAELVPLLTSGTVVEKAGEVVAEPEAKSEGEGAAAD
jgi:hypothetical protein